jgi:hypothetical protein
VARPNVFSAKYFGARHFSDYVSCLPSGGLCDADKSALSFPLCGQSAPLPHKLL